MMKKIFLFLCLVPFLVWSQPEVTNFTVKQGNEIRQYIKDSLQVEVRIKIGDSIATLRGIISNLEFVNLAGTDFTPQLPGQLIGVDSSYNFFNGKLYFYGGVREGYVDVYIDTVFLGSVPVPLPSSGTDPAVDAAIDSLRNFAVIQDVINKDIAFLINDLNNRLTNHINDTVVTTPIIPPQNVAGTGRDSSIFLTFEQLNPTLPDTFSVYRSSTSGDTNPTWIAKTTSLTYLDAGLLPGARWYYKLRRIEYPDSSIFSNEATAQVLYPILTATPTFLNWGVIPQSASDSTKATLVTNTSFGAMQITGVTITGTGASAFVSWGNTFPMTIASGDTKSVFIKADLSNAGSYSALATFSYNNSIGSTPAAISLGLTVTAPSTPYNLSADRYFSNVFGEDINSGTTPNDPLPLSEINTYLTSNTAQNIDTLRINAGETYILSAPILVSKSVYISDYGTGYDPILSGNNALTGIIIANADSFTLRNVELKNINPIGGTSSNNTNAIIYLSPSANYCTLDSLKLSNTLRSGNQWIGMIFGKDVHHLTVTNSDFSGGLTPLNLMANYQNSHKDVHHILYDNNRFHKIVDRAAIWFQQWFQTAPDVEGMPGNVLGVEGVYRDITITNNQFDSLLTSGIYYAKDVHFYEGWTLNGVPQGRKQGYNWNISNNDFNLTMVAAIELSPISNRGGVNHPDTGTPIPWNVIANNRIDSAGYDYRTGQPTTQTGTGFFTCGIETHGWKQTYIEGNEISNVVSTINNSDAHGINIDFSPALGGVDVICDSVVIRRNIIYDCTWLNAAAGIHLATAGYNIEVYDNLVYRCSRAFRVHAWSMYGAKGYRMKDAIITNNTFVYNGIGISTETGLSGTNYVMRIWGDSKIVNNIVAYNGTGWLGGAGTYGWIDGTNVYCAGGAQDFCISDSVMHNNLYFSNGTNYNRIQVGGLAVGGIDILADPVFIDSASFNKVLDIKTSSFAINTGFDVTLRLPTNSSVYTDYLFRSKLSLRDIGAYEYQGSNPTSAPVVLSSNVTSIGQTTATLNATITSGNLVTTAKFEVRTDTMVAGNRYTVSPTSVSDFTPFYNLTGLTQATNYFYSTIATNSAGGDSVINNKRWYLLTTSTAATSFTDTLKMAGLGDDYQFYDSTRSGTVSRTGETTSTRRSTYELYTNNKIPARNIIDAVRFEKTAKTTSSTAVTAKFNFDETPLPVMPLTETALLALDTTANVSLITFTQWTAGIKYPIVIPTAELQELVDDADYSITDPIGAIWFGETTMSVSFRDWYRRDDGSNYNLLIVTHHTP